MIKRLRKILWKIRIIKDCPLCGKGLQKIGHEEVEGWQYYKCSNQECNFGKDEKCKQVSNGG
jgi:hypothetical protein